MAVGLGQVTDRGVETGQFEMVHLDSPSASCQPMPNFTRGDANVVGGFDPTSETISLCGGSDGGDQCLSYSRSSEFCSN